jgi:hypothetical protein
MSPEHDKLDAAADKLQHLAETAAAGGGVKAKLAQPLADDADFLRKVKPKLMKARLKGELPTDGKPGEGTVAPPGPQLGSRPKPPAQSKRSPWPVVGGSLGIGVLLAKVIDWRGHAHPRD